MFTRKSTKALMLAICAGAVVIGSAVGAASIASAAAPTPSSGMDEAQAQTHEIDPSTVKAAGSTLNGEYFTAMSTDGARCFLIKPAEDAGTIVSSCATDEQFAAHGIGLSIEFTDGEATSFGAYLVPSNETARLSGGDFTAVSDSVIEGSFAAASDPADASAARGGSSFELLPLGEVK